MANPWGPQNNFCYHYDNGSLQDHNFDRTPGTTPTSQPPAWSSANSQLLTPWIPFETPDNYDYRDFSFDGYVSHVYRH